MLHLRQVRNWRIMSRYVKTKVKVKVKVSVCLYFLTSNNHGIASKLYRLNGRKKPYYVFSLPRGVHMDKDNVSLWGCQGSLLVSYFKSTGLWIWKAGSTEMDSWT
ncbi:hypothetical protein RND81_11G032000 [Saponaria officinalis]|uniref:Uncharacterized protein n=1 Tax=Saponaria officinalis TaxID=3572 RepID=A0AAW1HHN6_SAPOF